MSIEAMPDAGPAKRRVYYISGFDPRGARFYHQLYKSEAALQEPINGFRYEVSKRGKTGEHTSAWHITATASAPEAATTDNAGTSPTRTVYTFLAWDDLIRANWITRRADVLARMPAYFARALGNGTMKKTRASTPRGFVTMVAPIFYTLLTLLLATLAGLAVAWLASRLMLGNWLAGLLGLAAAAAVIRGALVLADKHRMFWMMRIMLFVQHWGLRNPPELAERWRHFAELIHADNQQHPAEEVLIVGHSVGGLAAIAVAEHYLALQPQPLKPGPVKLLVLGNLTPLMGFIPEASWFREQLVRVGHSGLPWFDYSAPADPLCYRLVDPFSVCGLPAASAAYKIRSARFDRMFAKAAFKRRARDGFGIHFQYLMATHLPVDNDYFSLTAGPVATSPLNTPDAAA